MRARFQGALLGAALLSSIVVGQHPPDWVCRGFSHRTAASLAYDGARDRLVLFGGLRFRTETSELVGNQWTNRAPATSPPVRWGFPLVYDAGRRRVILFGGQAENLKALADTWEWDGNDWVQRFPSQKPPLRSDHAMVYDGIRQRTVLFGGFDPAPDRYYDDTWEWDGNNWLQRSTPSRPPARKSHKMAYDASRQRVVLFGGVGADGTPLGDTWEWDGSQWAQRTPAAGPPRGQLCAMTYDAARQRVTLLAYVSSIVPMQTWVWDGSAWTMLSPITVPPAHVPNGQPMTYDTARQRVVLYYYFGDVTWEWDGVNWLVGVKTTIPPLGQHALAYDVQRLRTVLFADASTGNLTWEWDGSSWTSYSPTPTPASRSTAMAYDAVRQRVLLFGGVGGLGSQFFSDTWEWDGSSWLLRLPLSSPLARAGHHLAYDAARQRVVLFGGVDSTSMLLGDTWEWDGTNWTQRTPSSSPPPRHDYAMAYDDVRQRTVLFGGRTASGRVADTWLWDGSNWTQAAPATSPSARQGCRAAYDTARRVVVLFGGVDVVQRYWVQDTWEWDGTNWTQRTPMPTEPYDGYSGWCAIAYDIARQRIVLRNRDGATWLYGPLTLASAKPLGAACSGTAGPPILTSNEPVVGGLINLDALAVRPSATCAFGLAAGSTSIVIGGGCSLYLKDPIIMLPAATTALGFASLQLPIPNQISLRGVVLFAQAFIADPMSPALGIAFTAGRTLIVGD